MKGKPPGFAGETPRVRQFRESFGTRCGGPLKNDSQEPQKQTALSPTLRREPILASGAPQGQHENSPGQGPPERSTGGAAALGSARHIEHLPFFEFGGSGHKARTTKLEKREANHSAPETQGGDGCFEPQPRCG
jgi:hypothetical protein